MVLDVTRIKMEDGKITISLRTGNLAILKEAMNEKCTSTAAIIYETAPISSA